MIDDVNAQSLAVWNVNFDVGFHSLASLTTSLFMVTRRKIEGQSASTCPSWSTASRAGAVRNLAKLTLSSYCTAIL